MGNNREMPFALPVRREPSGETWCLRDANGELIAMNLFGREATALVTAVNAHEKLVEALTDAAHRISYLLQFNAAVIGESEAEEVRSELARWDALLTSCKGEGEK